MDRAVHPSAGQGAPAATPGAFPGRSPEHATAPKPGIRMLDFEVFDCAPGIRFMCGALVCSHGDWSEETDEAGLKIVVIGKGELHTRAANGTKRLNRGPCAVMVASPAGRTYSRAYTPGVPVEFAILRLSAAVLHERFGVGVADLSAAVGANNDEPQSLDVTAHRSLQALCAQIAACPMRGIARSLYLSGKALELAGLVVELVADGSIPGSLLSASDVRRIEEAHHMLARDLRNVPNLEELAAAVGIGEALLSSGFKSIYGGTPHGVLQEMRLQQAYRLMSTGEMSASAVAWHVGYSPAHFSVAFKKRFGISPGTLRQTRTYNAPMRS